MKDQNYVNPFEDVRNKVKIFKDRLRETNKGDADLRESRLLRDAEEVLDKGPNPPANISSPEPSS